MSMLEPFCLVGPDGRLIRGDRAAGRDRQVLFITGFLSKRWGNKCKALEPNTAVGEVCATPIDRFLFPCFTCPEEILNESELRLSDELGI